MNDFEWKEFIQELTTKRVINIKEECKNRHVSLNTLYRKVSQLEETDNELYKKFIELYPYKPRDVQGIDFRQLMIESILTGISQRDLAIKYNVDFRTLQRKFKKIESEDSKLSEIYKMYVNLKKGESLPYSILEKLALEYIPQKAITTEENLQNRRKQFIESFNNAKEGKDYNLANHYREQIERIDLQIKNARQKEEGR